MQIYTIIFRIKVFLHVLYLLTLEKNVSGEILHTKKNVFLAIFN